MKKFVFSTVIDLTLLHATVLKMNSFIYCKTVKPVRNICGGAKSLVKLLTYCLEYSNKQ